MLVHTEGGEDHLLDFFVAAAPGRGPTAASPARAAREGVEVVPM
jgi:hypothetical protein